MSKFMAASRQATDLDKDKIKMDAKVLALEWESNKRVAERLQLQDKVKHLEFEVKELKNVDKELKTNIIDKESRLDKL